MKQFEGKVVFKVEQSSAYPSEDDAALGAEIYLNGDVATEVWKRYGVHLRVHIHEVAKS